MSLTVKDNGGDFQPAPEGFHIARCYAVIDLGLQFSKKFNNMAPKVLIAWELSDNFMADGRPFVQMQSYTGSLSQNAKLRGVLEAWRGKGFTTEELQGFTLRSLLGVPCYLTTKHTPNPQGGQPWSTIISICRLPPNVTCPPPVNPPIYFDLDDYSETAYCAVSEGIRKKINLKGVTGIQAGAATTLIQADTPLQAIPSVTPAQEDLKDVPF